MLSWLYDHFNCPGILVWIRGHFKKVSAHRFFSVFISARGFPDVVVFNRIFLLDTFSAAVFKLLSGT